MSGTATVIGITVNHQQWLPGFEPPYAIANVALADDPTIHLTTNIVGCDPDDVAIGDEVQVTFEHVDDVWIPLFEPTGVHTDVDPVPEPVRPTVRPPLTDDRYEHASVISGIGRSELGRRLMRDPLSLTVDAALAAIADAGLSPDDIDGLATYPGGVGYEIGFSEGGISAVEEALRLRPTWICGGGDVPGPGGSILNAMMAVANGLCRHVLCFRTVWQTTAGSLRLGNMPGRLVGDMVWRSPFGAMSAANWIGMNASQYLHRYGATRELLGHIAVNARRNAGLNPDAIYREPMTLDDYFDARMVTTPFGLYDCDVPCDGAMAVIVSAADVAPDLPKPAVRIEAAGTQITERLSWDQDTVTHEPQVIGPATHVWTRTSLTPDDIDLALLYDGFTFNCVSWIEALGFCGFGEAQDWIDGGATIALDGKLPLNPHGGQLSEGRTHGMGFFYEAVTQLRGDAGERQVRDATTAIVSSGGGTPSSAVILQRADA
jgi:acetyl-CoA acetyltransferase